MTTATMALRGARVLRDDGRATPRDLLLRNGRIVSVVSAGESLDADTTVDLDGAVLYPGFVDGHCHLELTVQALEFQVPLHAPPMTNLSEMMAVIAAERATRPRGWIIARSSFGLQRHVAEQRLPHRDELDAVSPREPLAVLAGLHVACLNTPAIIALGLGGDDALPRWITAHRDADGLTGVFTEVWDRLPTHPEAEVVTALRAHARASFSSQGTTSVSTIPTSAEDVRALHTLAEAGELPLRIRFFTHVPRVADLDGVLAWGPRSGFGDDMLRFGGVKIFVDGEGGDGLGARLDDAKWTQGDLDAFVDRSDAAGIQLMMHAVTPHALRMAARAVLASRSRRPASVRHRIEHGGDCLDVADLPLVKAAGVGLVATPHFAESSDPGSEDFQPLRTIVDAGCRIIGGTDATGTVPTATGALTNIAAAAGRRDGDGAPSRHRIGVADAVRMFTTWSAEGVSEHHEKGRIAPGFLADFAVLNDDPFATRPEELRRLQVEQTILGGQVVWDRSTHAARHPLRPIGEAPTTHQARDREDR